MSSKERKGGIKNMKAISFVIPVYNEEQRIKKTFAALKMLSLPRGLILDEIIFVNDGSMDGTLDQISNLKSQIEEILKTKVTVISHQPNRGKGYAVRQGMLVSRADYTLFFDADISTPLSEIKKFVPFISKNVDVIIGTRKNGESTVIKHQPLFREILGKVYTKITKLALGLAVSDFTCGFKAFRKDASFRIFSKSKVSGWCYDAEIIFLAKRQHFTYAEKAVLWANEEHSKVNLYKAIPQTLWDLFFIRWEHELTPRLFEFAKNVALRYGSKVTPSKAA
jgi:dolichyl-phosphate beta-glucosyltransferase